MIPFNAESVEKIQEYMALIQNNMKNKCKYKVIQKKITFCATKLQHERNNYLEKNSFVTTPAVKLSFLHQYICI